ncbi:MAG: hypothetical protein WDN01_05640 [Rhizomicrobium sp.]
MSSDMEIELYRTQRASQERYTYFMLAAAGAAIAFAVTRSQDMVLSLSQIPLGTAVLCWGFSFFSGCMNLRYVDSTLFANFELLKVESGRHPKVGSHPQMMEAAGGGIRDAIESNSKRTSTYARLQFYFLIIGAIFFIAWDVFEMYLRIKP